MSIVTIAVNTVVEVPLAFTRLGEGGIAAGTLVSFALQAIVMLFMLDRKIGGLGLGGIARNTVKMLIACGVMAAACWAVQQLSGYPHATSHLASAEQLMILMLTGAVSYFAVCRLLGFRAGAMLHGDKSSAESSARPY